jgi:hypothetical protein
VRTTRLATAGGEPALLLAGGIATVAASYLAVQLGAQIGIGVILVGAAFVATVIAFITAPHLAVAGTIVLFSLTPALKVFVSAEAGALKDLVVLAAVTAAVILIAFEGRRVDGPVLTLVVLLIALYLLNAGGTHDLAWAQGVRLIAEPLLMLLVGLVLPEPRRTFRFALGALIATCCAVAAYGIFQQYVGEFRLVSWGYSFDQQVRTLPNGFLRSFGTLDDPFAYAALLCFGFAAVVLWVRRGPLAWGAGALITIGLGLAFVRTSALILVAIGGLWLARSGRQTASLLVILAAIALGAVALSTSNASKTESHPVGNTNTAAGVNVVLNGRISAWEAALGPRPSAWLLGRGVGVVGTAAERAGYLLTPSKDQPDANVAVDSGYLAIVADVGIAGLVVLLALAARLISLGADTARRGVAAGWVTLGLLATLLIDALTRASFSGFPTAFLGLLLIGLGLAAARDEAAMRTGAPALRV